MHYQNAIKKGTRLGWLIGKSSYDADFPGTFPILSFFKEGAREMIWRSGEYFDEKEIVKLPDGTLVFLKKVGRNSTHSFYVGQSQDGQLYQMTASQDAVLFDDMMVGEEGTYLGRCEFLVYRMWLNAIEDSHLQGYWGHI
jgi:hypothetical protein